MFAKIVKASWGYIATGVIVFLGMLLWWPRDVVEIEVPAQVETVDEVKPEFEASFRAFSDKAEYRAFVDSVLSERKVVKVPVPGKTTIDTVEVEAQHDCVPVLPGVYSARFNRSFNYPIGDTSQAHISLSYVQNDWLLHPDGRFENVNVSLPQLNLEKETPRHPQGFFSKWFNRALYFGIGYGVSALANK